MLSLHVRPALNRVLTPIAGGLVRMGVTADAVTVVGTLGVVGGALGFYPRGSFLWGTVFITCFVFSDMIDGAVARARGSAGSRWGAFLDSSLDRFGDAAVFGGIALWFAGRGHSVTMAAVAIYCLATSLIVSYVKARAEGLGMTCNVGIAERAERLVAILAATGFAGLLHLPAIQVVTLWVLAVATTVTIAQRLFAVRRQAVVPVQP